LKIVTGCADYVGPWVFREIGKIWYPGSGTALGWVNPAGDLVAGVTFTGYDGANIWLDAAALPKARWADRRALWAVFHYPFEQLGCVRVSSLVPEENKVAQKFNESAGLVHEATLSRAAPNNGDMRVYRMFREDCRWLRREG
jgi:hypothetical protein